MPPVLIDLAPMFLRLLWIAGVFVFVVIGAVAAITILTGKD